MAIRRFESNGRYSNVVEHNGVLYLTGQLCSNPAGDVKQQTKEILEKTIRHNHSGFYRYEIRSV